MDFDLSNEQTMLMNSLKDMAKREKFEELSAEKDETGTFPVELIEKFAGMGLLGMTVSAEFNGGDESLLTSVLAIESLARFSPAIAGPVFESNLGAAKIIDMFGTKELKKEILAGVCTGDIRVSSCVAEPETGADVNSMQTRVKDKGESLLLNGKKTCVSFSGDNSHYLVCAAWEDNTDSRQIAAVIVQSNSKGIGCEEEDLMGLNGIPSRIVTFNNTIIDKKNIVIDKTSPGEVNKLLAMEHCGYGAICLGIAGGAIENARKHALERVAFGHKIREFQAIQLMIADMAMSLDAARMLVYRAAGSGVKDLPDLYHSAAAKCVASKMVKEATDLALQIFGGYGYSTEYPLERLVRDSRTMSLLGGSLEGLKEAAAEMVFTGKKVI